MADAPAFYSQAGCFLSAVTSGIDPRTGLYTANITLGKLIGNDLLGPTLPISLSYSPLASLNAAVTTGFGNGVSLGMTMYDSHTDSGGFSRMTLSTGEQYVVLEQDDGLEIQQKKLDTVHVKKYSDRYEVLHKSGDVEILMGPSDMSMYKAPTRIINALGHGLDLQWNEDLEFPRLTSVTDDRQRTLLSVNYDDPDTPVLKFWPGQAEAFEVSLSLDSALLKGIEMRGPDKPLVWTLRFAPQGDGSWGNWLDQIVFPGGLTETVMYYQDGTGAGFPDSAGLPVVPQAYQITRDPVAGMPAMVVNYTYTDTGFLGAHSGVAWDQSQDSLLGTMTDYVYGSTETHSDGTTIDRTYNCYHLMSDEVVSNNGCQRSVHLDYYAVSGDSFDDQPAQYQCVKTHTVTWKSPAGSRQEITATEYNEYGNLISRTDPDGTKTTWEYYPAGGADGCPAEPNGFTRFVKSVTKTPYATSYKDTSAQTAVYQYASV